MSSKHLVRVASFVFLERDGMIVLQRRFNTGYMDGFYQMPSGHIEAGEYPAEAAIREIKEEVGVDILPADLELIHASYRITCDDAGDYVDFFFKTSKWRGEVHNTEPEKCDDLVWVPIDMLPENTVPVVKEVIGYIRQGLPFSEVGRENKK